MFAPNTVVRLLSNVDLTKDYRNTFDFPTEQSQASFFIGKSIYTFTDFTYRRKEQSVKVAVNIENLWKVSYMMFQNSNFGNKWFYAFITDMRYINDGTTEIFYEIDVFQTWLFDIDVKDSFIEREHVSNDSIGNHTIEENLYTGEYVNISDTQITEIKDLSIVLSASQDSTGADVEGGLFTGVYSGLAYYASDDTSIINGVIGLYVSMGKADAINNIFMMPTNLIGDITPEDLRIVAPFPTDIPVSYPKNTSNIDGYVPRNNKLFVYPYNYLYVTNHKDGHSIYRYEFSSLSTMDFNVTSNVAPNPIVSLIPKNYKGVTLNKDEIITLSDYPLCNWTTDVYNNWIAQNVVSNAVSVGGSILGLGVGVATGNPVAIGSGVLGVANSIGQFYEKSIEPNPSKGRMSGGGSVASDTQTFTVYQKTIRSENAKIIDDFFHAYGYRINEVRTPNLKSRLNWNYIKLNQPNVTGDFPRNDMETVRTAFSNGITFWHNDNIGNYNRNNPII